MESYSHLEKYGLFDAKVPRFTSYPPANHFQAEIGRRFQPEWIDRIPAGEPLSIYVHIPFCRRLCWFCACRTQGTRTLGPVAHYLESLLAEIDHVVGRLTASPRIARLHLGGGTPTLLTVTLMNRLLQRIHERFARTPDFEFSVEIDPTEADPRLLQCLADWGLNRASVGVQDFSPEVQAAIGRPQSYSETLCVIQQLRDLGVASLNLDLLYGLPRQTGESLMKTMDLVEALRPDRLSLYGYAHVPHMSKRQVMIDTATVPDTRTRFYLAANAHTRLTNAGYVPLGIDHYALPDDSLAKAAADKRMRRNFQGYTDDPAETLIGFGASAISRFAHGYTQNAVATAAYHSRIEDSGLAGHRGIRLGRNERAIGLLIEQLMCSFESDLEAIKNSTGCDADILKSRVQGVVEIFPDAVGFKGGILKISPEFHRLARVIAARLQGKIASQNAHSHAI